MKIRSHFFWHPATHGDIVRVCDLADDPLDDAARRVALREVGPVGVDEPEHGAGTVGAARGDVLQEVANVLVADRRPRRAVYI
jgi:hypothetical protein